MAPYYTLNSAKTKPKDKPGIDFYEYYADLGKPSADLKHSCRVCLKPGRISIYNEEKPFNVEEALHFITGINISYADEYPKLLCKMCYEFLNAVIAFKNVAKQTELKLLNSLKRHVKIEVKKSSENEGNKLDKVQNDTKSSKSSPAQDMRYECEDKDQTNDKDDDYSDTLEDVKRPRKLPCQICGRLVNRTYYKTHLSIHDPNQQKYICDTCGKAFRLKSACFAHSLIHKRTFPFKCKLCPYRGHYPFLFKRHMRIHTREFPYACPHCPAKFHVRSNMNRHMLKHKEPRFKCSSCPKSFYIESSLRNHYNADHLGIKNHVCDLCGSVFGYKSALRKHMVRVHKAKKSSRVGRTPFYLAEENGDKNEEVNE